MKGKRVRQRFHSQSGKKAQVMSVDSTLSYFLFALFLLLTSNYIINVSKPFTSYVNYEVIYKNTESLNREFKTGDVSREYLNNVCNSSYANVVSTRASYKTRAIKLPAYDKKTNTSKQGVHYEREGDSVRITYNTNTTLSLNYVLITQEDVTITEYNTEESDDYNKTRDDNIVTITLSVNNTFEDVDEYEITTNAKTIMFINYYQDVENAYLGKTPMSYSCGLSRNLAKKSYFNSYAVLEELNAIANYGVEVWWE